MYILVMSGHSARCPEKRGLKEYCTSVSTFTSNCGFVSSSDKAFAIYHVLIYLTFVCGTFMIDLVSQSEQISTVTYVRSISKKFNEHQARIWQYLR